MYRNYTGSLFTRFEKLSIKELERIAKKYREGFLDIITEYRAQEVRYVEYKKRLEKVASWESRVKEIEKYLFKLRQELDKNKASVVSRLFVLGDVFWHDGQCYKGSTARKLISEINDIEKRLSPMKQNRPSEGDVVNQPWIGKPYYRMTTNGVTIYIDFSALKIEEIESLISKKKKLLQQEQNKIKEMKARAAQSEKETRRLAVRSKGKLRKQLEKFNKCPYCCGHINESNAHQDHIYPVSRGGKSAECNLVFVCRECNVKKSDLTLALFAEKQRYDILKIHKRLRFLEKHP